MTRKKTTPAGLATVREIVGQREVTAAEAAANLAKVEALTRLVPSERLAALQRIGPRHARPAKPGLVRGLTAADLWGAYRRGALPTPVKVPRRGYAWPLSAVQALR